MVERIIEGCLRNRFLVVAFFLLVTGWAVWAFLRIPIDALPDLSENQVIVFTEWLGRSPQEVEDQITYPLVVNLQGLAGVKVIRSSSSFSFSTVYIIFEDALDLYWVRTRVLERLALAANFLPPGVTPTLGPDATALGHVMWYSLEGKGYDLGQLRAIQDWFVRYQLTAVPGVAEVGSVGGFVRQYQIDVDPVKLRAHQVSLRDLFSAVQRSNVNVGAKVLEQGGRELIVRGLGLLESPQDIENVVLGARNGTPVYLRNVAKVQVGPEFRRGFLVTGSGDEAVGGVVVARLGVSSIEVLDGIKRKIKEIEPGLPPGVKIVPFYDRSELIHATMATLRRTLLEEAAIVAVVVGVFLLHVGSIVTILVSLPVGVLVAFLLMYYMGISANITSLGGIAIAVGVMVDAGLVIVENIYRHFAEKQQRGEPIDYVHDTMLAAKEVGRPIFFSMVIIILAFVPVFALQATEGKLFRPLAWTKNLSMAAAAFLSITLLPVLATVLVRARRFHPLERNPLTRLAIRTYMPIARGALTHKLTVVLLALVVLVGSFALLPSIGQEFMPPLEEGTALWMPEMLPGISLSQSLDVLRRQCQMVSRAPEVAKVVCKAGRAETSTDPTGISTGDSIITWKPPEQWRPGLTKERLIEELDAATRMPGVTNIWTMPIIDRIQMLSTGIPTDVGVKIFGSDLRVLERLGLAVEDAVKGVPGAKDVFAMRPVSTPYVEIRPNRTEIARYGVNIRDVQDAIEVAIGGVNVTTTIEGRQRFPVRVRYAREFREDLESLRRILVPTALAGMDIPLGQLADFRVVTGPGGISGENGLLVNTVLFNVRGRDVVSAVEEAQKAVAARVQVAPGYFLNWSGQYEHQVRARQTLEWVIPVVLFIIYLLLYITFRSFAVATLVMLSIPFAVTGGIVYLYLLGYHMSVAVWVGFIALFGLAAETGIVMVMYLEDAYDRWQRAGRLRTLRDLREAVLDGAVLRVRPKLMTVGAIIMGLIPIMWSHGPGSDVMKPIATPLIGGMVSSTVLTLIILPVLYLWLKQRGFKPVTVPRPAPAPERGVVRAPVEVGRVSDGPLGADARSERAPGA